MTDADRRAATIARMEAAGRLLPDCPGCESRYAAANPLNVIAPPHVGSAACESGGHPHCSCDRCF